METLLIALALGFAYWLGYRVGRKSAIKSIMPIVEDVVTKQYVRKNDHFPRSRTR